MFELIEQVKDYNRYPSLAELLTHAHAFNGKHGFHIKTIGASRMGRDIEMVSFGNGSKPAILLWGFEDPHEPICALSMIWLWEQLADIHSPIHKFEYNWAFIPCLNPDGVLRNEQWFHHPGDLRAFINGSWDEENTFYGPPTSTEQFALAEAIVQAKPELLFGMHDESHFPGYGYWAHVSDEKIQESLTHHFEYEKLIGVDLVPPPLKPLDMRNNWYHGQALRLTGRCLSMICEPRAYRRLAPPRDPENEVRERYLFALSEYKSAIREIVTSSEEEQAIIKCAASSIEYMQNERLFFICVGSCALRVIKAHGRTDLSESIERAFWEYMDARLNNTYTTIPIKDQVKVQLHFLFSVMTEAKKKNDFQQ